MMLRTRVSGLACAAAVALLGAAPAHAEPFQRGFTVMGSTVGSYLTERSDRNVNRLASDGSSDIAIVTRWLMDSPTSSSLAPDPERTPSDDAVAHAADTARAAG